MSGIYVRVHGVPAPQGSKRHVGRGIMVESSKRVKPWREACKWAFRLAGVEPVAGAVMLRIQFYVPRPKSAKKGAVPSKRPDLDKLLRSTLDALTDVGVIEDDARVVSVMAAKAYAGEAGPGADIYIDRWE